MDTMLSPGSALQYGNYVVEALIEAAPNGSLYWGTNIVTGMPVYIQAIPTPPLVNADEGPDLVERLQHLAFSTESPLPSPLRLFKEGKDTCYLVVGTAVGLPWQQAYQSQGAMSPKQALSAIRAIANGVIWLEHQGISPIDLSPNRVWVDSAGRVTLTGVFGIPQSASPSALQPIAANAPIQALGHLLYSFLSGALPGASASLAAQLEAQNPYISPLILQAINQAERDGTTTDHASTITAIQRWLTLLPDAGTVTPTQRSLPPAPSSRAFGGRLGGWGAYSALTVTALLAAMGGGTLGTFWRLSGDSLPGAVQFDPSQSFPAQAEWPGHTVEDLFERPYLSEQDASYRRQEDWVESDWETTLPPPEAPIRGESPVWVEPASIPDTELPSDEANILTDVSDRSETEESLEVDPDSLEPDSLGKEIWSEEEDRSTEAEGFPPSSRPDGVVPLPLPALSREEVFSNAPLEDAAPAKLEPAPPAEVDLIPVPTTESTSEG